MIQKGKRYMPARKAIFFIGLGLTCCAAAGWADIKLPPVFSSHMVLQRDQPAPVWGTATPGETVLIRYRGQEKSTKADGQGCWRIQLDPVAAGGPDILQVVAGTNTITLNDVLAGEVWVGSGQSNMRGNAGYYKQYDAVLAQAVAAGPYPRLRLLQAGKWQAASSNAMDHFSALMFAFGLRLHETLNIPVGLMVGAADGTASGAWLSEAAYRSDVACKEAAEKFAATYDFEAARKKHALAMEKWEKATAEWQSATNKTGRAPRPPAPPQKAGECSTNVGYLYEARIRPLIPYGIRGVLWDQGEGGTDITGVDQYTLMGTLIRGWRGDWGQGDFPFLYVQKPSGGGCAWDSTDPIAKGADAFTALPEILPPVEGGRYRETHIRIMGYPNTALVTTSDLEKAHHPLNKSGYGARAARVALGFVYGKQVEIYGPAYKSHTIEGDKIRISFTHVGQGLAFRPGVKLQGFAVAGADKMFHWADAVIDGDTVLVSSPRGTTPVAVRYAWAATHPWANLFNKDGLPALSFRTDTW